MLERTISCLGSFRQNIYIFSFISFANHACMRLVEPSTPTIRSSKNMWKSFLRDKWQVPKDIPTKKGEKHAVVSPCINLPPAITSRLAPGVYDELPAGTAVQFHWCYFGHAFLRVKRLAYAWAGAADGNVSLVVAIIHPHWLGDAGATLLCLFVSETWWPSGASYAPEV